MPPTPPCGAVPPCARAAVSLAAAAEARRRTKTESAARRCTTAADRPLAIDSARHSADTIGREQATHTRGQPLALRTNTERLVDRADRARFRQATGSLASEPRDDRTSSKAAARPVSPSSCSRRRSGRPTYGEGGELCSWASRGLQCAGRRVERPVKLHRQRRTQARRSVASDGGDLTAGAESTGPLDGRPFGRPSCRGLLAALGSVVGRGRFGLD
jgi:hypothetical protein